MDTYLVDTNTKVDTSSVFYRDLTKTIPDELKLLCDSSIYKVKGSMGNGRKTSYPWIALLNKNITLSAQRGIYIVILFASDMNGFYLSLNQGITNYIESYGSMAYINVVKVAQYFQEQIESTTFSKQPIHLKSVKFDRGYGYEKANIVSKYYNKIELNEVELQDDIRELVAIYNSIYVHMYPKSYDETIEAILSSDLDILVDVPSAEQSLIAALGNDEIDEIFTVKTLEQIPIPEHSRNKSFTKITTRVIKKKDFIKKNIENSKVGLEGEGLVLEYEKERLISIGRPDLAEKIRWVSQESDSDGFDLQSYDLDQNGKEYPIFIEVKTTLNKFDNGLFITKNELEKSQKFQSQYRLYRIIDVSADRPKFYVTSGNIENNFELTPSLFSATLKVKS